MYIKKILLIGQTPPPYGGQAMMIERTLKGDYGCNIRIYHIRMNFSKEMSHMGKFKYRKIIHLIEVITKTYYYRFYHKINTLYYFPAGPKTIPVIRDIMILGFIRPLFSKLIYHFRAAGISEYIKKQNILYRSFLSIIYSKAEVGIRLSEYTPEDDQYLKVKKSYIVYNGIEDFYDQRSPATTRNAKLQLLYIGVINKTKGILDLINALAKLSNKNIVLNIIGQIESKQVRDEIDTLINNYLIHLQVRFLGVLTGGEKYNELSRCDIFVFPSYFESEGLPGAIIEAMCFAKPIVATKWRGIPSLINEGINGYLVPINSVEKLAERIEILVNDEEKRLEFGKQSRLMYLEKFTIDKYYKNMQMIFDSI